jgi:hypothetical protein
MLHIVNASGVPLMMFDIQGRIIKSILPKDDNEITNLSYLPRGLYIITNIKNRLTFKVVVK